MVGKKKRSSTKAEFPSELILSCPRWCLILFLLPTFFPNPKNREERLLHSLDVHRQTPLLSGQNKSLKKIWPAYYLWPRLWEKPASKQAISKWIFHYISFCYSHHGKEDPEMIALGPSYLCRFSEVGPCYNYILETAIWSFVHTFIKRYHLAASKSKAGFVTSILQGILSSL